MSRGEASGLGAVSGDNLERSAYLIAMPEALVGAAWEISDRPLQRDSGEEVTVMKLTLKTRKSSFAGASARG